MHAALQHSLPQVGPEQLLWRLCSARRAAASYTPGFTVQNRIFSVPIILQHACLMLEPRFVHRFALGSVLDASLIDPLFDFLLTNASAS